MLAALATRDQPDRADRHRIDHLHRAVQPGAPVRLARPHQRRPRRLEHRHLVARRRGAQLRRRRPGEPRRPLRARRGVHAGREGAVGQLGRRRGARRSRRRPLRQGRPHPADQPRRAHSTRSPGRSTCRAPAGPAGVRAGGLVRHRPPLRRAPCRGGVHRADGEGDGAGILRRPEGAGEAEGRARRPGADPAGPQPADRRAPRPRRSARCAS